MRTALFRLTALVALISVPGCASLAQDPRPDRVTVVYSDEELDNLVAPIALYPDALLAQILIASTFPDQVSIAAAYVRERGTRGIDDQNWDLSVKSVAHYPPVLNMLATQEDWAIALGQAYAAQSADIMDSVQRLREMARAQGNLYTTDEHEVQYDRDRIIIVPANPRVIYVPTYDPFVVYARPVFGVHYRAGFFSFGIGFPIGSWLVYDVDWWGRRIYYDGWYGGGWRVHSRRYIHITPVYVHPRYRVINININIFNRRVNYVNLDRRYRNVHRTVRWDRPDRERYRYGDRDRDRTRYGDRDGWNGGDSRGDDRDRPGRGGGNGNDRIGNRTATFDDFRPDRGGTDADARAAEPRSGDFGVIEKRATPQPRSRTTDVQPGQRGGAKVRANDNGRSTPPVFTSPRATTPRSESRRAERSPSSGRTIQVQPERAPKASSAPSNRPTVRPGGGGGNLGSAAVRSSGSSGKSQGAARPSGGGGGNRSAAVRSSGGGGGKSKPSGGGGGGGKGKGKN
jgi:hypothetical protein